MKIPAGHRSVTVLRRRDSCVFFRLMPLVFAGCFSTHTAFAWTNRFSVADPAPAESASAALTMRVTPSPEAQAAIDDVTLAYEEAQLAAETGRAEGIDPEATLEPDLPQSTVAEINGGEQSATPRRIHYQIGASVRGVYDDNINLSNTNREGDFYTAIEPSVTVGFGDALTRLNNFISLSYQPSAFIFSSHSEDDAFQHDIQLEGRYRFPRLSLELLQEVELLDGSDLGPILGLHGTGAARRVNLDVGGRTGLSIYNTRIDANYSLTGKTFLTGGLSYNVNDYSRLIDSAIFSGNGYFNYTYSPKLAIGIGFVGGFDVVGSSTSSDQTFEQLNARASYELTGKVSATITAGVEFRQYGGSGGGNSVSPEFDAQLLYQPFNGTNISLALARQTRNSAALGGQDYYNTTVTIALQQRFFQRFFLGLVAGNESLTYFSAFSGISSTRDDNYYFIESSVDFRITRYWLAGFYYLHRENSSTLNIFSFYDNQCGVRTTLSF